MAMPHPTALRLRYIVRNSTFARPRGLAWGESKRSRRSGAGAKKRRHCFQRAAECLRRFGADAVSWNGESEVAHVSVSSREQHAIVRGKAGDDQFANTAKAQHRVERRLVETGQRRLEHDVIGFARSQKFDNRRAWNGGFAAERHERVDIGPPFAEVVVDVNDRNAGP